MRSISVMVKPASSACNMQCAYCFYADVAAARQVGSHGIMTSEMSETLAERLAEAVGFAGDVTINFQGGEPTLAGLDWFRRFAELMEAYPGVTPHWALQTNGTLLDREWCAFLAEHDFLVGISLDGPRSLTDRFRRDGAGEGAYERAMRAIEMLWDVDIDPNILTVVTRQLAQKPKQLMQFYLSHDLTHVQLIPCLPSLGGADDGMSLRPADYRSFYLGFFRAWLRAYQHKQLVYVNLFDNVLGMLEGYAPNQCGMIGRCTLQYVIESNGDVYPCDFYCLDEYRMGNIAHDRLRDMTSSKVSRRFIDEEDCRRTPCTSCPYATLCGGGCRRQNVCYLTDGRCAHRDVLAQILPALAETYGLG
jgi:uncharacterized protein